MDVYSETGHCLIRTNVLSSGQRAEGQTLIKDWPVQSDLSPHRHTGMEMCGPPRLSMMKHLLQLLLHRAQTSAEEQEAAEGGRSRRFRHRKSTFK